MAELDKTLGDHLSQQDSCCVDRERLYKFSMLSVYPARVNTAIDLLVYEITFCFCFACISLWFDHLFLKYATLSLHSPTCLHWYLK